MIFSTVSFLLFSVCVCVSSCSSSFFFFYLCFIIISSLSLFLSLSFFLSISLSLSPSLSLSTISHILTFIDWLEKYLACKKKLATMRKFSFCWNVNYWYSTIRFRIYNRSILVTRSYPSTEIIDLEPIVRHRGDFLLRLAAQLNTEQVTILTTKRPSKCYTATFMRFPLFHPPMITLKKNVKRLIWNLYARAVPHLHESPFFFAYLFRFSFVFFPLFLSFFLICFLCVLVFLFFSFF